MLKFAVNFGEPIAVRYPRGEAFDGLREYRNPIELGKAEWLCHESGVVLFAVGSMVKTALEVRELLKEQKIPCSIVNARFVKPIDQEVLAEAAKDHHLFVTMEENVASGGYGEKVRASIDRQELPAKLLTVTIPDTYVEHGNVDLLKKELGLDAESIARKIMSVENREG